jgi:hypothetical protein
MLGKTSNTYVGDIEDFEDAGNHDEASGQQQQQVVERENKNASYDGTTARQPVAQRCVVMIAAVAVVIAVEVALVVGICRTGHGSSPTPSPLPQPTPLPWPVPVPKPVPNPVPVQILLAPVPISPLSTATRYLAEP